MKASTVALAIGDPNGIGPEIAVLLGKRQRGGKGGGENERQSQEKQGAF